MLSGIIGVGVQLVALAILRSGLDWTIRAATIVAVECAVLHNFVWHERWTWAHRALDWRGIPSRLLRFNVSNGLISIVGNVVLMELLAVRLSPQLHDFEPRGNRRLLAAEFFRQ